MVDKIKHDRVRCLGGMVGLIYEVVGGSSRVRKKRKTFINVEFMVEGTLLTKQKCRSSDGRKS